MAEPVALVRDTTDRKYPSVGRFQRTEKNVPHTLSDRVDRVIYVRVWTYVRMDFCVVLASLTDKTTVNDFCSGIKREKYQTPLDRFVIRRSETFRSDSSERFSVGSVVFTRESFLYRLPFSRLLSLVHAVAWPREKFDHPVRPGEHFRDEFRSVSYASSSTLPPLPPPLIGTLLENQNR